MDRYREKRDLLYNHLVNLGFLALNRKGFLPVSQSINSDDVEFAGIAQKYNLLLVPGKGFGWPGYFRLAYCVSLETIKASLPAFTALAAELLPV